MATGSLTLAEHETIIRWDREERVVNVYSADPVTWRRCEKLGLECWREERNRDGNVTGRDYRMALTDFRWGKKTRQVISEADREARRERLRKPRTPVDSTGPEQRTAGT